MTTKARKQRWRVADFVDAMEALAPVSAAQDWDNAGLIAGNESSRVERVLMCIDLMPDVAREAVARKVNLIMAYHPPIFRPVKRLTTGKADPTAEVVECLRRGIGVYSTHTALDAADGGTNDVLAAFCGMTATEPIRYETPARRSSKLVVFVPESSLDTVSRALFNAGAGRIGDYTHCSFRTPGNGTFFGGASTSPSVGRKGRLEVVAEVRLECIVPNTDLPAVISAMVAAHPYEEPAYDLYPVTGAPERGIGRVGTIDVPKPLAKLARTLKRKTHAPVVSMVGQGDAIIQRAIILVGAAGSIPFEAGPGPGDVIVTGEIRHHDALAIVRRGANAIALGHWSSERPALAALARRLKDRLPGVEFIESNADVEPFQKV